MRERDEVKRVLCVVMREGAQKAENLERDLVALRDYNIELEHVIRDVAVMTPDKSAKAALRDALHPSKQ